MLKTVFQFALIFLFGVSYAYSGDLESRKSYPPFYISQVQKDSTMFYLQSKLKVDFRFGQPVASGTRIYMSVNGLLEDVSYEVGQYKEFDLTPGKYVFKIWGGPGYEEVISDSVLVEAQTIYTAVVQMNSALQPIMVFKPVIYFHSNKTIDFTANVVPNGNFVFTYPSISDGWKGTISPNGNINVNGKNYPYLFWEANSTYSFKPTTNGFHVNKSDYVAFLEQKCAELGFSDQERTDFVTFWGMKMSAHEDLFVQFIIDDACNQFADLSVSPAPNEIKRVYICISPWDSSFEPHLKNETFKMINTSGFSVLEWGGYEFSIPQNDFTNL